MSERPSEVELEHGSVDTGDTIQDSAPVGSTHISREERLLGTIPHNYWPSEELASHALGLMDKLGVLWLPILSVDYARDGMVPIINRPASGRYEPSNRNNEDRGKVWLIGYERMSTLDRYLAVAHEFGHAEGPYNAPYIYGTNRNTTRDQEREYIENIKRYLEQVCYQSCISGVYLNNYHLDLCRALERGQITPSRLYDETFAILHELVIVAPARLRAIELAQWRAFPRYMRERGVRLTTFENEKRSVGFDRIIIANELLREVTSLASLRLRQSYVAANIPADEFAQFVEWPIARSGPLPHGFIEHMLFSLGIRPPTIRK